MNVTKILGEQAGIQYQGVQDKSEADPRDHLVNALFTGIFKNGPFNKPFKVTEANIRKKLGFDPENLQYQAIEDCLKQGTPFVWVMRVDTELKWGPWQLGQDFSILNGIARYTGFKTDTKHAFDSFAEIDLTVAITASLSDSNMQQWQAVKDAVASLIGPGVGYEWDNVGSRISYVQVKPLKACYPDGSNCTDSPYLYQSNWACQINYEVILARSVAELAELTAARYKKHYLENAGNGFEYAAGEVGENYFTLNSSNGSSSCQVWRDNNPNYAPEITPILYKSFTELAQKIISNASSSDQGVSLLAETYIEEIAKGVTLENLIQQFEQNKIKR